MPRKANAPVEAEPVVVPVEEKPGNPFNVFIDHQRKAVDEAGKALSSLVPEGLKEHGQNALREMVEGYRALFNTTIDDVIKTLEKARIDEDAEAGEKKAEKVEINA